LIDVNLGAEIGAEPVHDRDDRRRNAGGDQAVLDRGGAGSSARNFFKTSLMVCNLPAVRLSASS